LINLSSAPETIKGKVAQKEEVEDFVMLVADMKHGVHFESLFEGGPQFLLQLTLELRMPRELEEQRRGLGKCGAILAAHHALGMRIIDSDPQEYVAI